MDRMQASVRMMLWLVLADIPIILIPLVLYMRSHNYHLLLIPLPVGLIVNTAIIMARRKTLQRITNA
jgi:hypothetical protein